MSGAQRRPTFDRVRPRTAPDGEVPVPLGAPGTVDADGKRALFSQTSAAATFGAVTVECSQCGRESALTPTQWLRAALPSVHLPGLRRSYPSWMRCPACGRRTWVRLRIRV